PVCSGTGQGTFLNLTHVYGCAPNFGSIAHVHPDQHDLDFMVANSKAILYFANDGGIYRALDGYSGLTTGDCSGTNQFDSLNQTLGSMSQFVSFSEHPIDLNTILGGTQDVGTCRVWRGATSGTGFSVLSNNFETGGDGICGGNEVNLVRSLAAGGIKDTSGFSNVMYAGTDGLGPLQPTGGHVWVSTNVDSAAWFDRTGAINPGKFPISNAAIDPSDKTGKTAYVAIMGF